MQKKSTALLALVIVFIASAGRPVVLWAAPAFADKDFNLTSPNDPSKPVPGGVRWFWRMHGDYLNRTKLNNFEICFLGDSITQMWPGDIFGKYFGKYKCANFGIGGDRCENVLLRLDDGELKDCTPKLIVLMLGTNNQGMNTAEEIAFGVSIVVKSLQVKCPQSHILILGILPSAGTPYEKTSAINDGIAKLADGKKISYFNFGAKLQDQNQKMLPNMFSDSVHLSREGYEEWGKEVAPIVNTIMAKDPSPPPTP